jgi:hypothetical protein
MSENDELIQIDKMSVDQAAGAFVMVAGAIGSLLLVVWQSKCHCKVNLCYIFQCDRRPPNEDEMKTLKDQAKKLNKKDDIKNPKKPNDDEAQNEDELSTPRLIPRNKSKERIIENESEIDKLV